MMYEVNDKFASHSKGSESNDVVAAALCRIQNSSGITTLLAYVRAEMIDMYLLLYGNERKTFQLAQVQNWFPETIDRSRHA